MNSRKSPTKSINRRPKVTDRPWFVIRCKPNQEYIAELNLENQDAETYLPRLKDGPKITPLFRPYLFVRKPPDGTWRFILSTRGVLTILMTDQSPALLSHEVIREIKSWETNNLIVTDPENDIQEPIFRPGEMIKVLNGPFKDLKGHVLSENNGNRVAVLLDLLNRKTIVKLPSKSVEKEL